MNRAEDILEILKKKALLLVGFLAIISGCKEPDPFPNTPSISFERLRFVETADNTPDSLILEFNFEDGDGDLGIESDETFPPFHDFDFIVDSTGRAVTLSADDVVLPFYRYVPYTNKSTLYSEDDSRPAYSCDDYDTLRINEARDTYIPQGANPNFQGSEEFHVDTLFIVKNETRSNMYVDFYWDRVGNGDFELLDWAYITNEFGCGETFNGRFPILDEDNMGTSLQGLIKYSMISSGFEIVLRNYPFKLKFWIYDRSLNKSNEVETPVFTMDQLLNQGKD